MTADVYTPAGVRSLPRDRTGRRIPWFVHTDPASGVPDFRVIREGGLATAHRRRLCWVCGNHRPQLAAFVLGPMCAVNRVNSEPPSHVDCAVFAALACPFLSRPEMRRLGHDDLGPLDDATAGTAIERNPGVACVWSSRDHQPFRVPPMPGKPNTAGVLWNVGWPAAVRWFCRGRPATRAEVWESIESGLPRLRAAAELDGPKGVRVLDRSLAYTMTLLPAEDGAR